MTDSINNIYSRIDYLKSSFKENIKNAKPEFVNNFNEMLTERMQRNTYNTNTKEIHPLLATPVTNDIEDKNVENKNMDTKTTTKSSNDNTASRIENAVEKYSKQYKLPKELINSVIKQESNFDPYSRSNAGAMGLMQLMPNTAKELGVKDPFSIEENINGGTKYLKMMLEKYNWNLDHALAAYNAGPHRVDYAGGIPNIPETQDYVNKIKKNFFK